jgi:lysophospholipase L1-like esterase
MLAATALVAASCVGDDSESDPAETTVPTTRASTTTITRATTTTVVPIFPEISWSMPQRFGLDGDNDGRIDVPNTAEYLRDLPPGSCSRVCPAGAPAFSVLLDASGSESEAGPIQEYRWEVRAGPDVVASEASTEPTTEVRLAEGRYEVSVTVIAGGRSAVERQTIEVRDHLIVVLGDSYASGEGNPESSDRSGPEVVGIWADDGLPDGSAVNEGHRRAHRSTLAASPQAALELEAADPRSSVSLLFLARSGAEIVEGMLETQPGLTGAVSESDLLPQIDATAELLGCFATPDGPRCDRTIDALTLTIGGNDIGFNVVIGGLVAADPALSFRRAYEFALSQVFGVAEAGLRDLDRLYEELDDAIRSRLQVDDIYLIAYPSATGSGDDLCDVVADDLVPGLEADRDEILETVARVVEPLGEAMEDAAATHGWRYVDGHLGEFGRHGYCGSEPYPASAYPGNPFPDFVPASSDPGVRWFRQAGESSQIQGGTGGRFEPADLATDGTLHPNELGHQRIKEALLEVLDLG